jgi:parvulin-like peptidyl-prolyl isomerase
MGRALPSRLLFTALLAAAPGTAAQKVADRVAARVENDIILESEVRELGQYQQLVEGRAEPEAQRLDRLIDQWIVRTEAEAARFPKPTATEIDGEVDRVRKLFPSFEAFQQRLRDSALTEGSLRRIIGEQLYLTRYLDSRFRAAVHVEQSAIEAYYRDEFAARLARTAAGVPPLDDVRPQIREILIQRGITEQASRWLAESRSRLRIEKELK